MFLSLSIIIDQTKVNFDLPDGSFILALPAPCQIFFRPWPDQIFILVALCANFGKEFSILVYWHDDIKHFLILQCKSAIVRWERKRHPCFLEELLIPEHLNVLPALGVKVVQLSLCIILHILVDFSASRSIDLSFCTVLRGLTTHLTNPLGDHCAVQTLTI